MQGRLGFIEFPLAPVGPDAGPTAGEAEGERTVFRVDVLQVAFLVATKKRELKPERGAVRHSKVELFLQRSIPQYVRRGEAPDHLGNRSVDGSVIRQNAQVCHTGEPTKADPI